MAYSGVFIYVLFILQFCLYRAQGNFRFYMDDASKGHKCLDEKITFEMTSGKSPCALRCWMDLACSSMIYFPDTGKCTGCTSFNGVTDLSQSNSVFYKRAYQYLGCYNDCPKIMELISEVQISSSQSTENCLTYCKNLDSSFSLTEYANECWCGASVNFTIAEKVSESKCSWSCKGNTSQKCGADCIGSLYRTGV